MSLFLRVGVGTAILIIISVNYGMVPMLLAALYGFCYAIAAIIDK